MGGRVGFHCRAAHSSNSGAGRPFSSFLHREKRAHLRNSLPTPSRTPPPRAKRIGAPTVPCCSRLPASLPSHSEREPSVAQLLQGRSCQAAWVSAAETLTRATGFAMRGQGRTWRPTHAGPATRRPSTLPHVCPLSEKLVLFQPRCSRF